MKDKPSTSCRFCVFKTQDHTNTQTGCLLGRLSKFVEQGASLLSREEDGERFFIIDGRFCTTLRTGLWAKEQTDVVQAVRREILIRCDFIIITNSNTKLEDIHRTVHTAINQNVLPKTIRVVLTPKLRYTEPLDVIDMMDETVGDKVNYYVDVVKIVHDSRERMIDIAAEKSEDSTYYAVFNAGFEIPQTFLSDIDESVNGNLNRFCLLEPNKDGNGLVVLHSFHKCLMGNREVTLKTYSDGEMIGDEIVDKAKFVAGDSKMKHMIQKVTDICKTI